jgi:flagellar hook-length control protein FliK
MLQPLIPTASPATEVHSGSAVSNSRDKGFRTVLKSTVSKTVDSGSDESMVKARDTHSMVPSAHNKSFGTELKSSVSKTGDAGSNDNMVKTPEQGNAKQTSVADARAAAEKKDAQPSDAVKTEILNQSPSEGQPSIAAQIAVAAQQMIIPPPVAEASVALLALIVQPANSGAKQEVNGLVLQNNAGDQQNSSNGNNIWGTLGQNVVAAAGKAAGNTRNTLMDMAGQSFQDEQTRALQNPASAAPDFAAAVGKSSALLSAKESAFDESIALQKSGLLSEGQTGDIQSSKDAAGVYTQILQSHSVTTRTVAPAQETIPVSRLDSVDAAISKAVSSGQTEIVLKIDPPDLGSMSIRLSYDSGVLKADVRVDSSMVKDSFTNAMPQIKLALENAGIKVSQFNVDVRDDQSRQEQDRNNQNRQQQQRQAGDFGNSFSHFFA